MPEDSRFNLLSFLLVSAFRTHYTDRSVMPDLAHLFPELDLMRTQLVQALTGPSSADQAGEKAIQAWNAGLPDLTVQWCERAGPGFDVLRAIALNRQGHPEQALAVLQHGTDALSLVHQGSSLWQLGDLEAAQGRLNQGLQAARGERNASAIVTGSCLLGEVLLDLGEHKQAVVTLAEAFKIAEMTGTEADPYALAITSEAHIRWGHSRKAQLTTEKVFSRTRPFQLAHVRAKLSLGLIEAAHLQDALEIAQVLGWGFWANRLARILESKTG